MPFQDGTPTIEGIKTFKKWSNLDTKVTQEALVSNMTDADASIDVDVPAQGHAEDADDAQKEPTSCVEIIASSTNEVNRDIDPDSTTMHSDLPIAPLQEASLVPFSALGEVSSTSEANRDIDPDSTTMRFNLPIAPLQEASLVPFSALGEVLQENTVKRDGFAVVVPPSQDRWEYKVFSEDDAVDEILEEYDDAGFVEYLVLFSDGSEDVVSRLFWTSYSTHATFVPSPSPSPSLLLPEPFYTMTCILAVLALSFDVIIYMPSNAPFFNATIYLLLMHPHSSICPTPHTFLTSSHRQTQLIASVALE